MSERKTAFLDALQRRVLVLDGAMGTSLHEADLTLADYSDLENCVEILNKTRPDVIEGIHRSFLEVGSDAVETNTFGCNKIVLAEFDIPGKAYELNVAAARIARRAVDAFSTPQRPRFVLGSMGPGTKLITLRQVDYDTLLDSYAEQARGLIDGGADALIVETCQDILQAKTAAHACRVAMDKTGMRVPLIVQVTMETTGTMLVGTDIAAALVALDAFPEIDVIGLNCATGPQEMSEHVRYLARSSRRPVSVVPNAGLPQVRDGRTHFPLSPAELARWLLEFVEQDGVSIVGGCCGTTPAHIKAVVEAIGERTPKRREVSFEPSVSSLYGAVTCRQDNSFLIVGERSNTNGSRQFKRLLAEGDIDGLVNMGIEQVKEGSHVLDLCVDYVGREGAPDMTKVAGRYAVDVQAPLMLDSTQIDVLEAGLKLAGGKCIVNSVNLEDGEEKLDRIARLCRQHGAAVVALTIDEDPKEAMAKTADRKLAIAQRIFKLLTERHGIPPHDIFFDCLTFPITTGNVEDRRLALETLDGIERVMTAMPQCQSILGLSNVSFGLVPAARAVLNSVFLHEARQRGLTAAIVHASKILPRNKISDERWEAALDLIYDRRDRGSGIGDRGAGIGDRDVARPPSAGSTANRPSERKAPASAAPVDSHSRATPPSEREAQASAAPADARSPETAAQSKIQNPISKIPADPAEGGRATEDPAGREAIDPLEHFIGLFTEGEQIGEKVKIADLPIEERLKQRIIDGDRTGLPADLDDAMKQYAPLEIINRFLLDGMKVVGDLFGSGQMQLPFVLKSAETMKAAVAHLEPHMEKIEGQTRGKIVLATVRGDVHDIGKNLVDILMSNNGYTVYNLGIKQPINNIIEAWKQHKADAIGLSGLLVKSTLVMRDDLGVLNEHQITAPVILGGAALTRGYVEDDLRPQYGGPLFYAKDAFEGLRLIERIAKGDVSYGTKTRRHEGTEGETAGEHQRPADIGEHRRPAGAEEKDGETKRRRDEVPAGRAVSDKADPHGTEKDRSDKPAPGRSDAPQPSRDRKGAGLNAGDASQPSRARKEAGTNADRLANAKQAPDEAETAARASGELLHREAEQRFGLTDIGDFDDDNNAGEASADSPPRTDDVPERSTIAASASDPAAETSAATAVALRRSDIAADNPIPAVPFWGRRVVESIPVKAALGYLNETMLFQVQWGFRKKGRSPEEFKRYVDAEIRPHYRQLVERCERENILDLRAIYGFWPCNADGNDLIIYAPPPDDRASDAAAKRPSDEGPATPGNPKSKIQNPKSNGDSPRSHGREIARFTFPRQRKSPHWCLADFWRPVESGEVDVVAFSLVTAGRRVSEIAREWFARNEYQQYLFLHGLGVETAEALAEYIHKQVRVELNIAGEDARDRQALFKQGYCGSRFSFGYPACPNLEDQATLMSLLGGGDIGVTLSDEFQLDPEQSTSAIIAHHPQARYFNVR